MTLTKRILLRLEIFFKYHSLTSAQRNAIYRSRLGIYNNLIKVKND